MSRSQTARRAHLLAAAFDDARYFPGADQHGDQRSYEPERAAAHLASLSPERRAELNAEWAK